MTTITVMEQKIIYFQLIFMAVILAFFALYAASGIRPSTVGVETSASNSLSVDASVTGSWINSLLYLPNGMDVAVQVTAVFISPLLVFDLIIAVRYAKDILTQWV